MNTLKEFWAFLSGDWYCMLMIAVLIHVSGYALGQRIMMASIKDVVDQAKEYDVANIVTMEASCKGFWIFRSGCDVRFNDETSK